VPACVGFVLGALFVWISDVLVPDADHAASALKVAPLAKTKRKRRASDAPLSSPKPSSLLAAQSNRRIMLLIMAVTLHNFPEGLAGKRAMVSSRGKLTLAVGVAFGGIGSCKDCTFESARMVAIGIGLQNFPEGLSVAVPLRRMGYSKSLAFFYGQLSGMVEPLGGLLGAVAVSFAKPLLPYALSFAAGAMVFVVADSVVPESHSRGNGRLASWGVVAGFCIMMSMDVALG